MYTSQSAIGETIVYSYDVPDTYISLPINNMKRSAVNVAIIHGGHNLLLMLLHPTQLPYVQRHQQERQISHALQSKLDKWLQRAYCLVRHRVK